MITRAEVEQIVQFELSRLRITGDSRIHFSGRFPTFASHFKTPIAEPAGGAGDISSPTVPLGWRVLIQRRMGNYQWAVVKGLLFDTQLNDPQQSTPLAVTGCLAVSDIISPTDPAWSNIPPSPSRIWIEGAYSTASWPALSGAPYINTTNYDGGALEYGTTTDGSGNTIFVQTFWRCLLAEHLGTNTDGTPQVYTHDKGILYLVNGGDFAFDSGGGNNVACPIIFPRA